jgi:hypothetical protein
MPSMRDRAFKGELGKDLTGLISTPINRNMRVDEGTSPSHFRGDLSGLQAEAHA